MPGLPFPNSHILEGLRDVVGIFQRVERSAKAAESQSVLRVDDDRVQEIQLPLVEPAPKS